MCKRKRLISLNFAGSIESLRSCPTTTLLHNENFTTRRKIDVDRGWVAQLAEQWTENLVLAPRSTFAPWNGCEHE